ncbi:PAC2 family protein [Agrococcus sp. Marseille-P2731]|uniref:PAC2 family protein n=1 Tax=Agrococcus sp. Marseille-P2731 TaxID=1841862 RepID=UPI000930B4BB|nr:PAC2 family protein [Agrococcus sp. Marseille-P2731]
MARGPIEGRIMVIAFEGWTDAGDASSSAVKRLIEACGLEAFDEIEPDEFVDFGVHRPVVRTLDDGTRALQWPATIAYAPTRPSEKTSLAADAGFDVSTGNEGEIYALVGAEPSRNWTAFAAEFLEIARGCEVDAIVFVGSMLADVPHTRPIATTTTSDSRELQARLGVLQSEYEGPTGIMSVLGLLAQEAGIQTASLWASVPHYVHNAPAPKAVVALLDRLSEMLDVTIPLGDLPEQSGEWERGIDEITERDDDMRAYIGKLEEQRDAVESPEASGEAIAHEFERFLRDQNGKPRQGGRAPAAPPQSAPDAGTGAAADDTPDADAPDAGVPTADGQDPAPQGEQTPGDDDEPREGAPGA